jgi:hypothetical protein
LCFEKDGGHFDPEGWGGMYLRKVSNFAHIHTV